MRPRRQFVSTFICFSSFHLLFLTAPSYSRHSGRKSCLLLFVSTWFLLGGRVVLVDLAKGGAGFGVFVLSIYRYGAMHSPFCLDLDRYEIW